MLSLLPAAQNQKEEKISDGGSDGIGDQVVHVKAAKLCYVLGGLDGQGGQKSCRDRQIEFRRLRECFWKQIAEGDEEEHISDEGIEIHVVDHPETAVLPVQRISYGSEGHEEGDPIRARRACKQGKEQQTEEIGKGDEPHEIPAPGQLQQKKGQHDKTESQKHLDITLGSREQCPDRIVHKQLAYETLHKWPPS